MKKDMFEVKQVKKPYVKPTIEAIVGMSENICLVSASQQLPPMESEDMEDEEDENNENSAWTSNSVWKD